MKGTRLLRSMGHVDEGFLADAMETPAPARRRKGRMAIAAACLLLLAGAALWHSRQPYVIDLDRVAVNPLTAVYPAQSDYDPAGLRQISWESREITEYYGRDLTPAYIPEDLEPLQSECTAQVLVDADGTVVRDMVEVVYTADHEAEDTQDGQNLRGFSMTVSTQDALVWEYASPGDQRQTVDIDGVQVTLGEIAVTDTRGEYESFAVYTASFTLEEVRYSLRFQQLDMKDVVKVVASIIRGDDRIEVK